MNLLSLGILNVLNVLPIYYAIIKKIIPIQANLVTGKVTELNQKLQQGNIDISVISSFEYARNPDLYYIFPNLSISSNGAVHSIYLFLNKPLEELNQDFIYLTSSSLTSIHLIQFLLQEYPVQYTQNHVTKCAGKLLIADEAIQEYFLQKEAFIKKKIYIYDLGTLWKEKTNLPFVFALWAIRRSSFHSFTKESISVYHTLHQSKEISQQHLSKIAQEYYLNIFPSANICERYLNNLKYEFTQPYQKGFELFQEKMKEIGKLKQVAPLHFLPFLEF